MNLKAPVLNHRVRRQQLCQNTLNCFVPIKPARFGKQICEVFTLPCRLSYRLQSKIGNHPRTKTFTLFYSHRIEGTAVRINTNEKVLFRLKILKRFRRININHFTLLVKNHQLKLVAF